MGGLDAAFPRRLNSVELLVPIGRGGMAIVFAGRCEISTGIYRDVAVKLLHPFLCAEPAGVEGLFHEAHAAARILHANVVGAQ